MTIQPLADRCTDSMIPGVYNYCDDWCAYCPVTTRCRAYGMRQSYEAAVEGAPRATLDDAARLTRAVAAADGLDTPALDAMADGDPEHEYRLAKADEPLARHALAYAIASELLVRKAGWLAPSQPQPGLAPPPLDVIVWFHLFLAMKTRRALVGAYRAERGHTLDLEDARGSAKIALISIDRSRAALREVAGSRVRTMARQLIVMLDLLETGLEARVPGARGYVRAGLDAEAP